VNLAYYLFKQLRSNTLKLVTLTHILNGTFVKEDLRVVLLVLVADYEFLLGTLLQDAAILHCHV